MAICRLQLWDDFIVEGNGTGRNTGEKADKAGIFEQGIVWLVSAIAVHEISDLLKGEEADAKRKQKRQGAQGGPKHPIYIFQKEVGILEITQ